MKGLMSTPLMTGKQRSQSDENHNIFSNQAVPDTVLPATGKPMTNRVSLRSPWTLQELFSSISCPQPSIQIALLPPMPPVPPCDA